MLQQRKKDYLIRMLEELMKSIHKLIDKREKMTVAEKEEALKNAFSFFADNFEVSSDDNVEAICEKVADADLLHQYANLLMIESDIKNNTDTDKLHKALQILEYLEATDNTYVWDRVVLKEDILHRLDGNALEKE